MTETGLIIFLVSVIGISVIAAIVAVIAAIGGAASSKREDIEEQQYNSIRVDEASNYIRCLY